MLAPSHILLLGLLILLALVVFGPKRLPELGASLGRAIQEFRRASTQAASEIRAAADLGPPASPVAPAGPIQAGPTVEAGQGGLEPIETAAPGGDAEVR